MGGSSPSAPSPSETAAAQQAVNQETARTQAALDRYDQINPFGSLTWTTIPGAYNGDEDKWLATQTLTPEAQAILDQQIASVGELSQALDYRSQAVRGAFEAPISELGTAPDASAIWNSVTGQFDQTQEDIDRYRAQATGLSNNATAAANQAAQAGQNFDLSSLSAVPTADQATRQAVQDALYQQATSRLDPQWQQSASDLDARLAAQGITQGSEAYDREMANFGRNKNDAYNTAMNSAITGSTDEMLKQYQAQLASHQQEVSDAEKAVSVPTNVASSLSNIADTQEGNVQQSLAALLSQQAAIPSIADSQYGYQNQSRLQDFSDQDLYLTTLLNQLNALKGGEITNPTFMNENTSASVSPTDYISAANNSYLSNLNSYNSTTAANNSLYGGLGMLGAAGAMSYWG